MKGAGIPPRFSDPYRIFLARFGQINSYFCLQRSIDRLNLQPVANLWRILVRFIHDGPFLRACRASAGLHMPVTLREVAERAGVSRSAVSRTFTEGASVSEKTRQKVEQAARDLGYSPNALASSLTTGRTKMIGLISNNFHNPIFLQVFDLFTRGLQDRGLRPLLVNLTDETDPENSVHMLRQYSVDGVIVASSTLPVTFARAFRDAGMPVVHSFGRHAASPQCPCGRD